MRKPDPGSFAAHEPISLTTRAYCHAHAQINSLWTISLYQTAPALPRETRFSLTRLYHHENKRKKGKEMRLAQIFVAWEFFTGLGNIFGSVFGNSGIPRH